MKLTHALITAAAITVLAGCAATGSTSPAAATQPPAGQPSAAAAASSAPCTTHACIASDAEGLKGTVAKDNSVMVRVACRKSTVKQVVNGTYTVHCTVTYSDGQVWDGIASVLLAQDRVAWEPTSMVSEGSG